MYSTRLLKSHLFNNLFVKSASSSSSSSLLFPFSEQTIIYTRTTHILFWPFFLFWFEISVNYHRFKWIGKREKSFWLTWILQYLIRLYYFSPLDCTIVWIRQTILVFLLFEDNIDIKWKIEHKKNQRFFSSSVVHLEKRAYNPKIDSILFRWNEFLECTMNVEWA